jgi:hypothetical protein
MPAPAVRVDESIQRILAGQRLAANSDRLVAFNVANHDGVCV